MFTIAQTMTLRKYKVYDNAEFVAIARRILGEGRRDDWQHTQFKIHTGDGIIPCFKDCAGSDYANIDQMSMRDAAKVLLWCDNIAVNLKPQAKIEPVPPNPLSIPHEVVTNNHFSEPGFVEKYAYHYDKLDYFHFDNLARALDVNDRYTIIGARTGGIIECVNKIGLKNVSYYDPSSECRDYIQKKYNIACVESYNVNLNKLIIFDMTSRDPTIVYRCVQGGGNVLVYDSQPYYPGCLSLKRCGQTLDYRYATNFGFYRTNAVDMSAAVTTLVSINPDTLCKVNTVYVHTDCESAMVFLKVVDPGRYYNYRFFGPLANELNVKHRCSKKERSGRCLFVIGKEAGYVKDLYHANDIVYSLPLDRELDNGFLNECLPLLGETTLYEISRLGFIAQDFTLYDCDYARGFVTTVNSEPVLAVNRWYYMRQTVDIRYYTRDNVYDPGAVKIKDAIFGFIRFRVSRPGYIRYSCDATHGQFFQHHIHIAKVVVNPDFRHSTRMYIRGSDLSNKPCLLNLETIHSDREDHLAYYRDLTLMCASDTEVVINGSWLYNPRGHSHIDARDLTKIADFCLCKGISVEDFMVTVFKLDIVYTDVDGEWVFNRIRALSVIESPDYVYCNGDVARDNYSYFGSGPILLYDKRSDCAFISVLLYCRSVPLEMSQEINV